MEKFLLLVREDLDARQKMSMEEFNQNIREMTAWIESLAEAENHIGSNGLNNEGRYVGRDYVLSDGPFIEAKEAISGYILVSAENLEQATSMAQICPLVMRGVAVIEVRPIMKVENGTYTR